MGNMETVKSCITTIELAKRMASDQQVYSESCWYHNNRMPLVQDAETAMKAYGEHRYKDFVDLCMTLRDKLLEIVKTEYSSWVSHMVYDIKCMKDQRTVFSFSNIDQLVESATRLQNWYNGSPALDANSINDFLRLFNSLRDAYYYTSMVFDFTGQILCYAKIAEALGNTIDADALVDIVVRCNRQGAIYVDRNNLYYLTSAAQPIVTRIIQSA